MSTQNARPIEGNDDVQTPRDDETTASARHPLGEEIAEYAPYARNDAHNGGGSQ